MPSSLSGFYPIPARIVVFKTISRYCLSCKTAHCWDSLIKITCSDLIWFKMYQDPLLPLSLPTKCTLVSQYIKRSSAWLVINHGKLNSSWMVIWYTELHWNHEFFCLIHLLHHGHPGWSQGSGLFIYSLVQCRTHTTCHLKNHASAFPACSAKGTFVLLS